MLVRTGVGDFTDGVVILPHAGLPMQKFLTMFGDATGSQQMTGNYSVTPADFFYLAVGFFDVHSLQITISDAAKFNQSDYGAITGGLTNGVRIFIYKTVVGVEFPLLSGVPFKTNQQWFQVTSGAVLTTFEGTPQTLSVTIDIQREYGIPLQMVKGDKLIVRLNDDFTPLTGHTAIIRGAAY